MPLRRILDDVKARGDAAVLKYTSRFDRLSGIALQQLEITRDEMQRAGAIAACAPCTL